MSDGDNEPPEPFGWAFQHDETGRWTALVNDGVNTPETFLRDNPRYAGPLLLYRQPPIQRPEGELEADVAEWLRGRGWRCEPA